MWTIHEDVSGPDKVIYIDIPSLDAAMIDKIDKYIAHICYGHDLFDKNKAKMHIKQFIARWKDKEKFGAVSEFFLHLYLNDEGFKQEFQFRNLEESSYKKGFDGVYKDSCGETWYLESKSGGGTSTHIKKVEEAYRDLRKKILGEVENDPWNNALNHVLTVDQNEKDLIALFRDYSNEFDNHIAHDLNDFNIMPCGSVICDGKARFMPTTISRGIFTYFSIRERKGLYAICVTNRCVAQFEAYLTT